MRLHFHNWSKWSEPIDVSYDYVKVQSRVCQECNKYQVKKVRQPWNTWFVASSIIKTSRGEE